MDNSYRKFMLSLLSQSLAVHATFVAAGNPDLQAAAREFFRGVGYMTPAFAHNDARFETFSGLYRQDHNESPYIAFLTAATVDALGLPQLYLDKSNSCDSEHFSEFLLLEGRNYERLMGRCSFDEKGNASLVFETNIMKQGDNSAMNVIAFGRGSRQFHQHEPSSPSFISRDLPRGLRIVCLDVQGTDSR